MTASRAASTPPAVANAPRLRPWAGRGGPISVARTLQALARAALLLSMSFAASAAGQQDVSSDDQSPTIGADPSGGRCMNQGSPAIEYRQDASCGFNKAGAPVAAKYDCFYTWDDVDRRCAKKCLHMGCYVP